MGRPPLPVGTFGKIHFLDQADGTVQARAKFRDFDGRTRRVARNGASAAAAERALKTAFVERQSPLSGGAVTAATKVSVLADAWLAQPHDDWSAGTRRVYMSMIKNQVKPGLGEMRVGEITAGAITRALNAVRAHSGPGAAKSTRACLSGMFGLAVEEGICATNPVRDSTAARSVARKARPRSFTIEQTEYVHDWARANELAVSRDLPDVIDWMLATGARIGEALAAREELNSDGRPTLDLEVGTWEVNATVIRVGGVRRMRALEAASVRSWEDDEELRALRGVGPGLHVQRRTKTDAGWRVIAIPQHAVDLAVARLHRERLAPPVSVLFSSPDAHALRDPSNTIHQMRELFDSIDCDACQQTGFQLHPDGTYVLNSRERRVRCDKGPFSWVTSHTFRKTVATRLEEAGFTARQVADHLGHANPSMTQDVYFGRSVAIAGAAAALDRRVGRAPQAS